MKKFYIFILTLSISLSGFSQLKKNKLGAMYFEKVYETTDRTKSELKNAVNEWIAINFNDANHVIKLNTNEKIINKGLVKSSYNWEGQNVEVTTDFDMISEFKEGKYRLTIENIQYKTPGSDFSPFEFDETKVSEEEWANIMKKQIAEMPEGPTKKHNQKLLDNPKKFSDFYKMGMKARRLIYDAIAPEIEAIGFSLEKYIKESGSEEEW